MNYQYLFFDLDGTLTDPKEGITKSVQYALTKEGYGTPPLSDLYSFIGPPLHEEFCRYCHVDQKEGLRLVDVYRERFGTVGLFENKVFDGIQPMLESLKSAGKVLAVATSKPTYYTMQILEKYDILKYFDVVVGSNMDGTRTIKKEIIEEVFSQLALTEKDYKSCLMIGDRRHDIIGANACGIDSVGVLFGYSVDDELKNAGATYLIQSVPELEKFLLNAKIG